MQRYFFPSLTRVVITFFLLGPCLWPICFLAVGFFLQLHLLHNIQNPLTVLLGIPLTSLIGAVMWWLASFRSNMWLATWIPTALAALSYWFIMSRLCERTDFEFKAKRYWVATNALICALVSAGIFFIVVGLGILMDAGVQTLPAELHSSTASQSLATLASWAAVVGAIGAVLGVVIGTFAAEVPKSSFKRIPDSIA